MSIFNTIIAKINRARDEAHDPQQKARIGHYLWLLEEHGMDSDRAVQETLIIFPFPKPRKR